MTRRQIWSLLAAAAGLAVLVSGCGDDEAPRVAPPPATERAEGGAAPASRPDRSFAEFTLVFDPSTLDTLDPGISFTVPGWQAIWNVYLGLLAYKHVSGPDGATLVPALAESMPEISDDGRTYRFRLREGLRYSNGKPVQASDFEYAVKRLFQAHSLGREFFRAVAGAERFEQTNRGDLTGIEADDDDRAIEITLTQPRGDFLNVLATTFGALVPSGTPPRDTGASPIPSAGPYRVARYRPGGGFTLERNSHFRPTADLPLPNPDRIVAVPERDPAKALDRVLKGDADYTLHHLPAARLPRLRRERPDQLRTYTPANTYYVFMNTREPPFDKLAVRRAVNHAIDRERLARLYGGLARPTQNVLPPTYPAYRELDLYPHDVARARRLIRQAGALGAAVTVWTSNRTTAQPQAAEVVKALESIGLRAQLKVVPAAFYWTTIGNQRTKAQIGMANWFQDYPHPLDWFDLLLNGNRITSTHNDNYANADVPAINRRIEALKRRPELTPEVNAEWAEVDRLVLEHALWAPYANREFVDFFAEGMDLDDCYVNHVLFELDFGQVCRADG